MRIATRMSKMATKMIKNDKWPKKLRIWPRKMRICPELPVGSSGLLCSLLSGKGPE
jgi:hypothetical protein